MTKELKGATEEETFRFLSVRVSKMKITAI